MKFTTIKVKGLGKVSRLTKRLPRNNDPFGDSVTVFLNTGTGLCWAVYRPATFIPDKAHESSLETICIGSFYKPQSKAELRFLIKSSFDWFLADHSTHPAKEAHSKVW